MSFERFNGAGGGAAEDRVDVHRYLSALNRDRRWIVAVVIAVTVAVFALSLVLPKSYNATATIVLDVQSGVFGPPDAESTQRRLATIESLLSSTEVLDEAAQEVGGGETAESLETKVDSSVDELTNLIEVTGSDGDPDTAAAIANAVAQSFLDVQQSLERERLNDAADALSREADEISGESGSQGEIEAINDRINDLRVQAASAGSDLQLAEQALPPADPASPRPLRNSVLAFFAALFIAILVSLGRDQLRPVIGSPREISAMFGRPVLSSVPYMPGRFSRSRRAVAAIAHEAYENLRSAVQITIPPDQERGQAILVTSAVHAEGKTTVVGRLGRGLARAGHRTLIISADLRWPSLHEQLGLPLAPGLTDALKLAERSGMSDYILPATTHDVRVDGAGSGPESDLHVLTSGTKPHDPARLLASDAMRALIDYATLEYTYVLLDAPPVIGLADVQGLAAVTDHTIFVAKLDRVTIDQAIDARELLERFGLDPVGLVVVGAKVDVSPYYVSERPPITVER